MIKITPTSKTYTLSLHDALPIYLDHVPAKGGQVGIDHNPLAPREVDHRVMLGLDELIRQIVAIGAGDAHGERSEEHTSELQSRFDLVCRLLLEKKKLLPSVFQLP